jgi:hypothetical protein
MQGGRREDPPAWARPKNQVTVIESSETDNNFKKAMNNIFRERKGGSLDVQEVR